MPSIDFSKVEGLEPIPPGVYLCSVKEAKEGKSNAGNDKIDVQWVVEEGEYAERILFDTLVWHPKALFRVKQTLQAFGYDDDFRGDIGPEELLGNTALLVVDIDETTNIDEATGEPYPPRNRVKRVKPAAAK